MKSPLGTAEADRIRPVKGKGFVMSIWRSLLLFSVGCYDTTVRKVTLRSPPAPGRPPVLIDLSSQSYSSVG